jgi:hypothetical protein
MNSILLSFCLMQTPAQQPVYYYYPNGQPVPIQGIFFNRRPSCPGPNCPGPNCPGPFGPRRPNGPNPNDAPPIDPNIPVEPPAKPPIVPPPGVDPPSSKPPLPNPVVPKQPEPKAVKGDKGDKGEAGPAGPAGKDAPPVNEQAIVNAVVSALATKLAAQDDKIKQLQEELLIYKNELSIVQGTLKGKIHVTLLPKSFGQASQ